MNAIIVEDELKSQVHLSRLMEKHCPDIIVSGIASNVADAYILVKQHSPDLILLDIELGKENGFELLQRLQEKQTRYSVVFTTAHEKYGIRAIKFSALDYLLKPIKATELVTAIGKARDLQLHAGKNEQINHLLSLLQLKVGQEQTIAISLSREVRFIQLSNICQVVAANSYSVLDLEGGEKLTVSKGIFHFDKLLVPAGFIRVHQSHIVNPRFIRSIKTKDNGASIQLQNGGMVPISRSKVEMVREQVVRLKR